MSKELDINSDILINWFNKNLESLSTIEEGYKIYINRENIIVHDEPYMFQGFWRYYNNINRKDTIFFINKLVDNIERYFNSLYIKTCMLKNKQKAMNIPESIVNEFKDIIDKLEKAKVGIINLSNTYKNDLVIVSEFEKIITNINNIVANFTKLYSQNYIL